MAAAEARAVWQRTANRFFVQEDAKRAPKLACRPSNSSLSSKQAETRPANCITDQNDRFPIPNEKSLYSDLSSDSRWWLQLQPDYLHQRGLTNSHQFVENQDGSSVNSLSKESFEFVEINTDSKFQKWAEIEKNGELPWWQTAEKDDLSSFISKGSHNCIDNRHLPKPTHTDLKPYQNPVLRDNKIHQCPKEKPIPVLEFESNKGKILEALRHSQTRARQAEIAAKEASAEKENVMKIVLRQASELFACRQWIHLLQIENLYYQIKNNKINSMSPVSPKGVPSKNGKLQKKMEKASPVKGKRRSRRCEDNLGKYAIVFAMGLGLVGAGLLLGWTVGWMFI